MQTTAAHTATRTRILSWEDIKDTAGSPSDLHADFVEGLVYNVSAYYRAMGSGDTGRFAAAAEMLRREERAYWATYEMNPRDIIDVEDPAVIIAHADHVVPILFNSLGDLIAHDHDVRSIFRNVTVRGKRGFGELWEEYREAYPTAPATVAEFLNLRRTLSVRPID